MTRLGLLREEALRTLAWLVLAIAGVDLLSAAPARLDLTRDGRFGLSDAAVDSVAHLDRELTVQVWFTEDLAPPYHEHRRALLDLLDDLAERSDHHVRVEVSDPTGDPDGVARAARSGIHPLPYTFRSWDRAETRSVFMGASFQYGDRQVAVDALPSLPHLELDVVRAIRAVTRDPERRSTIGWWIGHGEPDPATEPANSPITALARELRARGSFREVPAIDLPIPDDVDLLLIVAPSQPVPAVDLVHLDRFLMRGGRVLVFASGVRADPGRLALSEADHGLRPWLGSVGAVLGQDVLLDRRHDEVIGLPTSAGGARRIVPVQHPLALVTTRLERSATAVRHLPRLVLPFATPVSLADPLPAGVEGEVWAWTDDDAVARPDVRSLDPAAVARPDSTERPGPFPVMVASTGRFGSLFVERELPARLDPEAEPFDRTGWPTVSAPTRVAVVGSGDAAANNADLVGDTVDWLLEDEALIGIRARAAGEPPLEPPPRGTALRLKAAMVGAPLALLLAGAVATRRRSR